MFISCHIHSFIHLFFLSICSFHHVHVNFNVISISCQCHVNFTSVSFQVIHSNSFQMFFKTFISFILISFSSHGRFSPVQVHAHSHTHVNSMSIPFNAFVHFMYMSSAFRDHVVFIYSVSFHGHFPSFHSVIRPSIHCMPSLFCFNLFLHRKSLSLKDMNESINQRNNQSIEQSNNAPLISQ